MVFLTFLAIDKVTLMLSIFCSRFKGGFFHSIICNFKIFLYFAKEMSIRNYKFKLLSIYTGDIDETLSTFCFKLRAFF